MPSLPPQESQLHICGDTQDSSVLGCWVVGQPKKSCITTKELKMYLGERSGVWQTVLGQLGQGNRWFMRKKSWES